MYDIMIINNVTQLPHFVLQPKNGSFIININRLLRVHMVDFRLDMALLELLKNIKILASTLKD